MLLILVVTMISALKQQRGKFQIAQKGEAFSKKKQKSSKKKQNITSTVKLYKQDRLLGRKSSLVRQKLTNATNVHRNLRTQEHYEANEGFEFDSYADEAFVQDFPHMLSGESIAGPSRLPSSSQVQLPIATDSSRHQPTTTYTVPPSSMRAPVVSSTHPHRYPTAQLEYANVHHPHMSFAVHPTANNLSIHHNLVQPSNMHVQSTYPTQQPSFDHIPSSLSTYPSFSALPYPAVPASVLEGGDLSRTQSGSAAEMLQTTSDLQVIQYVPGMKQKRGRKKRI